MSEIEHDVNDFPEPYCIGCWDKGCAECRPSAEEIARLEPVPEEPF